jgi:hypothetical protein
MGLNNLVDVFYCNKKIEVPIKKSNKKGPRKMIKLG